MKSKINKVFLRLRYDHEPIKVRVIRDFLPSPDRLILKEKKKTDE